MKRKSIKKINWLEVQEFHNNGNLITQVLSEFKISRTLLESAIEKKMFKKIKIKRFHSEKTKELMSKKRKEFLKNNPDKHNWKYNSKFISIPCELFKNHLKENGVNFVEEFSPLEERSFSIDVAFPDKKIGIEINGNQHYNSDKTLKDYYKKRHDLITENGWKLFEVHYSLVYKEEFLKDMTHKLKDDFSLVNIDYSFFIKKKKIKRNREQFLLEAKEIRIKKNEHKLNLIICSNIDFSKFGWVKKAAKILGLSSQKVNKWMINYMPEFYNDKCFKKKTRINIDL